MPSLAKAAGVSSRKRAKTVGSQYFFMASAFLWAGVTHQAKCPPSPTDPKAKRTPSPKHGEAEDAFLPTAAAAAHKNRGGGGGMETPSALKGRGLSW